MRQPVITSHQPSMTEWFAAIGEESESVAFRKEDNAKTERLELLYQELGVPYERPERFEARDMLTPSSEFASILVSRGDELCAIRLVPKNPDLPKLRQRGLTIQRTYDEWLRKQDVKPEDYWAFLCPHSDVLLWSGTFVVQEHGIIGTLVRGMHSQLTHGDMESEPIQFSFDYTSWAFSTDDPEAEREARRMVAALHVPDAAKRASLQTHLDVTFAHEYLVGYFETTVWPDDVVRFIDYNRVLARHFAGLRLTPLHAATADGLHGACAYPGIVRGSARVVTPETVSTAIVTDEDILVCRNTDVRYLPHMQQARAIITEHGGILTHAAIVARELKKPCIVGVQGVMESARDGDLVEVDAEKGIVRVLR